MKTIPFLLLLAFCSGCSDVQAQADTLHFETGKITWVTPTDMNNLVWGNDTVKVIMLISDTSIKNHAPVFYQYGYRVYDRKPSLAIVTNYWYLDEKKRPLPKDIIVWQSHNANQ